MRLGGISKNPRSPPPVITPTNPPLRTTGSHGGPSPSFGMGKERKNRLLRALPLLLALTTIMFLLFSAVLHQPAVSQNDALNDAEPLMNGKRRPTALLRLLAYYAQPRPGETPLRTVKSGSGTHYQLNIEDLMPVVLRGTTNSERLAKQADQARQSSSKEEAVPPPPRLPPEIVEPQEEDVDQELTVKEEAQEADSGSGMIATVPEERAMASGRVLIFTMDSITAYEDRSKKGGAAGEITIRRSLESGLREMGLELEVARSDDEFASKGPSMGQYNIIILDSWTWAAPGWQPKPFLRGHEGRIFLLDFFGARTPTKNGIEVPPERILTAFDTTPWNTFLGYYMEEGESRGGEVVVKKNQGVVWGKDIKHFRGKDKVLRTVADMADLYSTLSQGLVDHPNIKYVGHQTPEGWRNLLAESKFLVGLGDPLLGPSAIDAISVGCVYINPVYDKPVKEIYDSQHPYAEEHIGRPYVCTVRLEDTEALKACVEEALAVTLPPMIPPQLTKEAYMARLWEIFGSFVDKQGEQGAAAPS